MISACRRIAVLGVLTLAVLAGAASEARAQIITFDPPTQPDLNFQVGATVNVTLPLATSTAGNIVSYALVVGAISFNGDGPGTADPDERVPGLLFGNINGMPRTIAGTPTEAVTVMVEYFVNDSDRNISDSINFTITVTEALALPTLDDQTFVAGSAITPVQLPVPTGGTAPYTYSLTGPSSAALPSGLGFDDDPDARTLSGTPTTAATTELTYSVMDSATTPATVTGTFDVTSTLPDDLIHIVSITRANDAPEFRNDLEGLAFDIRLSAPSDFTSTQIRQVISTLKVGDSVFLDSELGGRSEDVDDRTFRVILTSNERGLAQLSATENNIVGLVFDSNRRMQDIILAVPGFFEENLSTTLPTDANYETYTIDLKAPALAATDGVVVRDSGDNPLAGDARWIVGDTISVTWTFDEPINNFTGDDLEIVGTDTDGLGLSVDDFTGDDGAMTFSADLTLTGDPGGAATATLQVDEAGITDRAGNNPAAAVETFVFAPAVRPRVASIVRLSPVDEVTRTDALGWTVTFSIPVKNVDTTDFAPVFTDLEGAAITPSNPPVIATGVFFTKNSDTEWTVGVNLGGLADDTYNGKIGLALAENHNIVSMDGDIPLTDATPTGENQTFTVDNTAPMVTLSSPGGAANLRSPFTLTVAFSEAVPGFVPTSANVAVAVSGVTDAENNTASAMATLGAFTATTANQAWTAPVTLTAERRGAITANIAADVAMDAAGNNNTAATEFSATFDTTDAPSISAITRHTPSAERTNADRLTWEVVFSEVVNGVDAADFEIATPASGAATTATITGVTGDGATWRVTASGGDLATYNGEVGIALADAQDIMDVDPPAALLLAFDGDAPTFIVDNAAPALTAIAAPDAGSNNEVGTGAEIDIEFTFDAGDLDVASLSPTISPAAGGSFTTALTQDSTDPMEYTGTFTAGSEPETVFTITLTGYRDDVGNQGTATRTLTLTIVDVPTPTLSADQRYVVNNGVIPVTITFDQDVTGFDAIGDIEVVGGTATAPMAVGGSASEYTTMITSTADPTTVIVEANMAMSVATGENNVASNELEFTREPSVNTPTHKVGAPRLASVAIPSDKDRSREILNQNDTLEFVLEFDEAVLITSVECDDFAPPSGFECTRVQAVVGATLAQSDSDYATQFDLTYTLTGEANRAIQDVAVVLSSTRTITDQTGESLTGTQASGDSAEHEEIAVDTSALAMTLMDVAATGLAVSLVSDGALSPPSDTVEVRFGESATYDPNAEGALELEGATLESADETRAGFIWALNLRLDPGVAEVIVTVPAGQATDARGDMNVVVAKTFAVSQAQSEREMIADFMQRRASQIMAARPNLFGLLDGSGIGTSSLNLDDGPNRTFAFAGTGREIAGLFGKTSRGLSLNEADRAAARGDLWMSLKGIRTRTDDAEDDFYSMSVGAHRRLGADRIAGAFIALDQSKTEGRGEARDDSVEGDGWLAGPYLVGRVAERGLYYQVHAAWGQSSNAVRVGEGDENSFDTDRYLVGGALKGDYQLGEWSISPIVSADWFREEQEAYMSDGTRVDGQDITLGEVRAGPQFRRVLRLDSGADLSFKLGLHGVHNLAVDAEGDAPGTFEDGDTRGQVDVDFGYALKGAHLALGLRYDGIGQADYESWGADLRLRVTF